jgi:predicted nucleic acid-binding protein
MTHVIDASVAVRWTIEMPLSEEAERLLHSGRPLIAPDFVIVEVTNVLLGNIRARQDRVQRALDGLEFLPRWFAHLEPAIWLRHRAMTYAMQLDHSAYDCFYLALAVRENARMVTTDEKFIRKVETSDYSANIVHLADWEPAR